MKNFYPGAQLDYSNTAITLSGYILEFITSALFVDITENSLFQPLGIIHATRLFADCDKNNLVMQYIWNGSNYDEYGHSDSIIYPAVVLIINVSGFSKILSSFMQYGIIDTARILDSTTVELMTTLHFPSVSPFCGIGWRKLLLLRFNNK